MRKKINKGDKIFVYTDGLTENTYNGEKEALNLKVLKKILGEPYNHINEIKDKILNFYSDNMGVGIEGHDDVSFLLIKWFEE